MDSCHSFIGAARQPVQQQPLCTLRLTCRDLTAVRFDRGVADKFSSCDLRCMSLLPDGPDFRAPALNAQETHLSRVALHAVALKGQGPFKVVLAAVFIGRVFPALTASCTECYAIAVAAWPLVIADFPLLQDQPITLRQLRSKDLIWS
jgi:hypothetical protein